MLRYVGDAASTTLVRYGVRWGPVLGGFLLVVASVLLLRKWLRPHEHQTLPVLHKSKEYVYESEEDEDTTPPMITDAGSHSVSAAGDASSALCPSPRPRPGSAPPPGPPGRARRPPGARASPSCPTVVAIRPSWRRGRPAHPEDASWWVLSLLSKEHVRCANAPRQFTEKTLRVRDGGLVSLFR
ncbi:Protein of unknown function, partial [Gryllus bimaculatus]